MGVVMALMGDGDCEKGCEEGEGCEGLHGVSESE